MKGIFNNLVLLFVLSLVACNQRQHNNNPEKMDSITFCKVISIFKDFKAPETEKNLPIFAKKWNEIVKMDTTMLDALMTLENNSQPFHCDSVKVGFIDSRSECISNAGKAGTQLRYIYLICAMYEDNYYICSNNQLLYSKTFRINEINKGEKEIYLGGDYIDIAWRLIRSWRKKIRGLTLAQVRQKKIHPFGKKRDLYWIGEEGCLIDSCYNHQPYFGKRGDRWIQ